jgi:purine-nucleoside phosphorylase
LKVKEILISLGVEKFYTFGYAATVSSKHDIGELVYCHESYSTGSVINRYNNFLQRNEHVVDNGKNRTLSIIESRPKVDGQKVDFVKSLSISTPLRITKHDLEFCIEKKITTVDMESACVHTIGRFYSIQTDIFFIISDSISENNWTIQKIPKKKLKDQVERFISLIETTNE